MPVNNIAIIENALEYVESDKKTQVNDIVTEKIDVISPNRHKISPAISPIDEQERKTFHTIKQGTATNTLTTVKTGKKNTQINRITGNATVTQGNLSIFIPNYDKLTGIKTTTHQLLDALTVALTESGIKSQVVTMPLIEYMEKRGLKDIKEARKQVTEDLEILYNETISFKGEGKKGKQADFHDMRILDSKGIKNGIITVSFGIMFYNMLLGYPVMPYPRQLWALSNKRNPNSYYFLKKLSEHKNMNIGKKNEDTIGVKTLLAVTPDIPTYEEVLATDRALNRRIIEPFERDMDALDETLTWEYCHQNSKQLTDEELSVFSYDIFIGLLVKVNWRQYPNQTTRLERKAAKIKQIQQRKKTAKD